MTTDSDSPTPTAPVPNPVIDVETERVPSGQGGVKPRPPRRVRSGLAWAVALAADTIQWVALPFFAPGVASPFNNVLDVVVGLILVRVLGWHWALLPTFVAELIPGFDLVPTWTAAVWLATRGKPRE